jgi:hypothetical protein
MMKCYSRALLVSIPAKAIHSHSLMITRYTSYKAVLGSINTEVITYHDSSLVYAQTIIVNVL